MTDLPTSDNRDASEDMPPVSFAFVALSFFATMFVVFAAVAACIYGLPEWRV